MRRVPASIPVEIADITGAWLEEVLGAHAPGASVRVIEVADAHLGNMFVDGTTPGLLDWAVVGYAPGLRDVAYFLGGSVPIDLRREQERRLIARYCERLGADGVMLAIDAAWDQYRVQLVTAWIAAVVTPQWDRSGSRSRSAWAQRCARTRRSRITASPIC